MPGTPRFVEGVSMVRAEPLPVVNLELLLGGDDKSEVGRFVAVRAEAGPFVVAVSDVLGIREIPVDALRELPALLGANAASVALALASHDHRMIALLQAARLVPHEVWEALRAHGGAR
jgi:purine-binding chemotaxis protein CheW